MFRCCMFRRSKSVVIDDNIHITNFHRKTKSVRSRMRTAVAFRADKFDYETVRVCSLDFEKK